MAKGYQQLTYEQRCQIEALKKRGDSNRKVATQLGVHSSTIDRELKRNRGQRGYRHKQAHRKTQERRAIQARKPKRMTPDLIAVIQEKLTSYQWSPEQIAGWLKREHGIQVISHETIYRHIWQDKRQGGTLYLHLRRRAKKYQKRLNGRTSRGRIIGRVDIDRRPAIVETRTRLGDWEADTIVGAGRQSAVVSLVERKSRYTRLVKVERSTANQVQEAITQALQTLPALTITFDNGKEFAYHEAIAHTLEVETFFAKPYHSWERGSNENTNGLVRQYLPKQTDFRCVSDEEIARIEYLLNHRPRKCLGYDIPARAIQAAA